jgi:hypothetical protein
MSKTLERLRALHDAATEGPWRWEGEEPERERAVGVLANARDGIYGPHCPVLFGLSEDLQAPGAVFVFSFDQELIVGMRNTLPALLAVAEAAQAVMDAHMRWLSAMTTREEEVAQGERIDAMRMLKRALAALEAEPLP